MKNRLQSLGLLDRAIRTTSDEELEALIEALSDDHREAIERFTDGAATPDSIRAAAAKGRIDGTMEGLAMVLTDASLADCIEQLGDHADNPIDRPAPGGAARDRRAPRDRRDADDAGVDRRRRGDGGERDP